MYEFTTLIVASFTHFKSLSFPLKYLQLTLTFHKNTCINTT